MKQLLIPNPKQNGSSRHGRAAWYPYYAGYCPLFVEQILAGTDASAHATVLDPWNGAGTTSQVAHDLGHRVFGFDLNPAVHLIANARLANRQSLRFFRTRLLSIVRRAGSFRTKSYFTEDPLGNWFSDRGLTTIRHLDRAIREDFECDADFRLCADPLVNSSAPACFFSPHFFELFVA